MYEAIPFYPASMAQESTGGFNTISGLPLDRVDPAETSHPRPVVDLRSEK